MTSREVLSRHDLQRALGELADGWWMEEGAIGRRFGFGDFAEAWAFMTAVAAKAEEMNHHPEWTNVYNRVDVRLSTHDAGGVTGFDLELARFMDEAAARAAGAAAG